MIDTDPTLQFNHLARCIYGPKDTETFEQFKRWREEYIERWNDPTLQFNRWKREDDEAELRWNVLRFVRWAEKTHPAIYSKLRQDFEKSERGEEE